MFKRNQIKTKNILVIGSKGSGKSCIINSILSLNRNNKIIPVESLSAISNSGIIYSNCLYKDIKLSLCDMSSSLSSTNQLFLNYINELNRIHHGIIFVIDSSDRRKFEKSYLLLQTILQQEKLFYIPIVILANKNDNIYSCQVKDLSSALNLHNIRDRQWTVISSSTKTGDGISEGVDFLYNHMIEVIH